MEQQQPASPPPAAPPARAAPAPVAAPRQPSRGIDVIQVLTTAVQKGGSDIIFTVGSKPRIRIGGRLRNFGDEILSPEVTRRMLYSLLSDEQKAHFEETWEIDSAVNIKGVGRFRLNGFRQQNHVAAALRVIPSKLPSVDDLDLPQVVRDIAEYPRGLVLVTGPTGSGKSTLLAAILNKINSERECHIITIEDPIEFLHPHNRSVVQQREVGRDTKSFKNALKYILRQSPDVILLGEMRDPETIGAAITLAETGHLVFSTLHTQTCAQTMDRIIDSFPHEAQQQIRAQLSLTLRSVVCQTLIPTPDGTRCVAAREIMVVSPAIAALIREGKQHMITNSIQTGRGQGMVTMEASITELMEKGLVDPNVAAAKINSVRSYNPSDGKGGGGAPMKTFDPSKPKDDGPSDVDDMPSVTDAIPRSPQATKPREEDLPPLPEIPTQWLVIAAALASLGTTIFAFWKGKVSPINKWYALGFLGLFAVVYVVRWLRFKKARHDAEVLRMLGE
ncbi:MAG: type IV pilus twitching motility protein PilT [Candidatus Riflebacteria bacterium]|nr:type IV pilus twitching motility protein PilT [Candidatus Riflebacteria bacterium]